MSFAKRRQRVFLLVAGCLLAAVVLGFSPYFRRTPPHAPTEPLFSGLGPHTRKVTTDSPLCQKYFDQGLAFLFGFNQDEAIRSFEAASQCDPDCAMAYWGIASASFEYMFNPSVDEVKVKTAFAALSRARSLESRAMPVEQAMIEALAVRYVDPPPADRLPLDRAYYSALRRVWKDFPDDGDVASLAAQALFLTQRGGQWAPNGDPMPDTETIIDLLNRVLAKSPEHPFASHMLIHVVESSRHPEWGDQAADRLRHYEAPGLAHLSHMPSHIDIRRGRWQEAVAASEKAIAADEAYRKLVQPPGFYWLLMVHNNHMLAYAAAMRGERAKATSTVEQMLANYLTNDLRAKFPMMIDGFLAMPYELHLRFGRWDEMLALPPPGPEYPLATALWHFARGISFSAKRQVARAKAEAAEFSAARAAVPDGTTFRYTPAAGLLSVADAMLAGEILYRDGKVDQSIAVLKIAAQQEDYLPYSEPPDWFQPVRHALAAVLLDSGRYADAETVCREDLGHHPENGWSLFGLAQSLRKQKKNAEAVEVSARFKKAWQHADFKLTAPCLCLPGKD
jgi:tetratricopeptide (TPR) repeat protein